MRYRVLGPVEVWLGDGEIDVGSRQQRLVLTRLLAAAGRPVPPDTLLEMLWGEAPPRSALGTLQTYVSRLRKQLAPAGDGTRLALDEAGYRLVVDPETVDFLRFEQLADEGRGLLLRDEPAAAADVLAEALRLWQGPPFPELSDQEAVGGLVARLEERRLAAIEDRAEALLRLGRPGDVVAELGGLVVEHPFREDLRARLALALYRSGRQADALDVLADARRTLRDELGIDPGRSLQDLEAQILAQDPTLDAASSLPTARPPGGASDTATVTDGPVGLVGRDAELRMLLDALADAASDARFVVVEGDPGIGKTRLVEEFRSRAVARGSRVVWGRADESGAAPALWPWLPVLRAIRSDAVEVGAFDDLLAGAAPVLAGRGAAVRFEAFEGVARQLEVAGRPAPLVVLIDDLQWADEASLALLSALVGRLGAGVMVVATLRPLQIGGRDPVADTLGVIGESPRSRRIQLRGLTEADTAQLLAAAGLVMDTATSGRIHARAEGNPFYAIELARLLDTGTATTQEVPATVRDVVQRRLGRLPGATQDLLAVAAVTGRDVDLHLLARAAGLDVTTCLERLEPAVSGRVLVERPERPGVVSFSHALVREVLVDGLTSLRRARLHLAVADAIEVGGAGHDDTEIIAEHLWRAAPIGVGRRAAEALERAAEVALHRVSYAAAEDLLGRAVQLRRSAVTSDADLVAELATLVRLLEVMQTTRYFQATDRAVLARAQELAGRVGPDALSRTLQWFEWAALSTSGRVRKAAALARRAMDEAADDADPVLRFTAHAMWGTSCWQQGDFVAAAENLDAGVTLLAGLPPPADALEGEQRMVTASFQIVNHGFLRGDWPPEAVHAAFLGLMEGVPPLAVPAVCALGGATAACLGPWEAIEVYVDRALAADPASQFAFWGGAMGMQRGLAEVLAGRVDDGLASFAAGREQYVALGARTSLSNYLAWMGVLTARAGRLEEAGHLVRDARRELGEERWAEVMVRVAEAAVARARGDRASATTVLTSACDLAASKQALGLVRRVRQMADELDIGLAEPVPG